MSISKKDSILFIKTYIFTAGFLSFFFERFIFLFENQNDREGRTEKDHISP